MPNSHTGSWRYHDDDCRCTWVERYCNRDGWVWSCCGACQEDSDCTGTVMHPTHWSHPASSQTIAHWVRGRPVYKSKEALRDLFPAMFPAAP